MITVERYSEDKTKFVLLDREDVDKKSWMIARIEEVALGKGNLYNRIFLNYQRVDNKILISETYFVVGSFYQLNGIMILKSGIIKTDLNDVRLLRCAKVGDVLEMDEVTERDILESFDVGKDKQVNLKLLVNQALDYLMGLELDKTRIELERLLYFLDKR